MTTSHGDQTCDRSAVPPALRTHLGAAFTAANQSAALVLQHCPHCRAIQYPPRELCRHCLEDGLVWRDTATSGRLLSRIDLHHSLSEYFKRRTTESPWPVATVRLDCEVTVFAHLALASFGAVGSGAACRGADNAAAIPVGSRVQVFSHIDASLTAVLIAVGEKTRIATRAQRSAIADAMGLLYPSETGRHLI